jgi:SpoVK/Ycf46/Vps4 family AAA+-type ATPase
MSRRNPFKPPHHFLKKLRRRPRIYQRVPEEYRAQVALWMVRILILTKADLDELMDPAGLLDSEESPEENWLLKTVGLKVSDGHALKGPKAIRVLGEKLAEMEGQPIRHEGLLYANIDRLAELVGLSPVDKEVLAFVVLLRTQACLRECASGFESLSAAAAKDVLAEILGLDRTEVRRALKENGTLCSAGIVRVDRTEMELADMLDLLDGLDDALLGEPADGRTTFQAYFTPASPSSLTPDDFPHLREHFALLQTMLTKAIGRSLKGVNILIYGETGTGKTEFAKVLAASSGVQLSEISHENEDSDLDEKHQRFRAYLLCQKLLARKTDSMILFDEVEDVFPDSVLPFFGRERHSGRYKAWTNEVLESNPRPALWLCNEVHQIDPAFRRRFTYALHVQTPVRSVRRGILVKHLGDLPVSREWVEKMAANQELTPAMIEQACRVATVAGETDPAALERLMERVLQGGLEVMGLPPVLKNPHRFSVTQYSLDFLNPSQDLIELTQGLKRKPAGRVCLYGPPGSGKTAFAHYIAEQVDRPLLQTHASDLLSMWVGETEKHIAEMFCEAKEESAVLLLDEADSFLQDRRGAHHSWEVTQVNELLKQMETFEGLFICSTNLMDSLDQAVLRRFDLKIQFGYLRPDQAWAMFILALKGSNGDNPKPHISDSVRARLARFANLTPGDFATVIRQARVLGKQYDAEQLLEALEDECRAKQRSLKHIDGFVG